MTVLESAFVFVVSFLIGTVAIYVGGRVIAGTESVGTAAIAAFVGALVWAVVAFFVGWIPLLGPLLALIAYVGVLNWQYPGGWTRAAAIALVAWIVAVVILYVMAVVGVLQFEALGVPGA